MSGLANTELRQPGDVDTLSLPSNLFVSRPLLNSSSHHEQRLRRDISARKKTKVCQEENKGRRKRD
jgi:hypothetical protein